MHHQTASIFQSSFLLQITLFVFTQNKIYLEKKCLFNHEIAQDSEDEEPFTCNFAGFCPAQSPDDFSHPKPSHDGKDLDNVIFKTIYEPESLATGSCAHKCTYCGLSFSYEDLFNKKTSSADSTLGKLVDVTVNIESAVNSELCGDKLDSFTNESDVNNQLVFEKCHLMESNDSDLSDIESDNDSCNSNSSKSVKLTSNVIANLSMPKEELQYWIFYQ